MKIRNDEPWRETPEEKAPSRRPDASSALVQLVERLNAEKSLPQFLYEMRTLLSEATAAESATIIVLNEGGRVAHYSMDGSVPQAAGWIMVSEAAQRGLLKRVIRDKRYQLVADVSKSSEWFPRGFSSERVRSLLCVPLVSRGKVRGTICLTHPEAGHFDQPHRELVEMMANLIAIAVENALLRERTDEALRRRVAELSTLNALATIAGRSLDEEQILGDAIIEVCNALDVEGGIAYLLDADKEALFMRVTWGLDEMAPRDVAMLRRLPLGRGVTGRIVLTKTPLIVGMERYGEPRWRQMLIRNGVRTVMATPLLSRDAVQGALTLLSKHDRPSRAEDLRLLAAVGNQLGVAVENARLFAKSERRSQELNVINAVMQGITQTLVLDDILESICEQTTRLMGAETFFVGLLDEDGDQMHQKVLIDKGERLEPFSFSLSDGTSLSSYIAATGESLLFYDLQAQQGDLPVPGLAIGETPRSWLGVPMLLEDHVIGVMSIQSYEPNRFTEADRRVLSVIAHQTAAAISQARLFEQLQRRMKQLQEAQARLMQSEKMAALGELVSGVAHELNNPLTAVVGYAQLLQLRDLDDDVKRDLQRIYEGARRSSKIVNDLLTFARSYRSERKPVDINQALEQMLSLRAYEMRVHNVKVTTDLSPDLPLTVGDPHRLEQVFLNLIVNAEQALGDMEGGGSITVRTFMPPDRPDVIRIEFEDSGPGVPAEVMGRIFDPFFTTKEVGKGTGLGLSICYGIVTEHGGRIWAENKADRAAGFGSGAIFVVELPLVPTEEASAEREQTAEKPVKDEVRLHMLVVDDEPDVAELISRVAEPRGHRVERASDGIQALKSLGETDFEIIFCDLKMPGMSGDALFRRVAEEQPELAERFYFVSGDTVNDESRAFIGESGRPLITKPFGLAEIGEVLAQAVEKTQQRRDTGSTV